jgi:hypothetical protein
MFSVLLLRLIFCECTCNANSHYIASSRTVFDVPWHRVSSQSFCILTCSNNVSHVHDRPAPAALALGGIRKVLARARELADGAAPDELGQ